MSHPAYVVLQKRVGETPLGCLQAWRDANPEYSTLSATYAGRLDPMASGKLLILLGDECKKRGDYMGLDKEYVIDVVLDLKTDTGDALGVPAYADVTTNVSRADAASATRTLIGSESLPYPAFSSKTVNGTPLFMYALSGTLNTISIPTHTETIHRAEVLKLEKLSRDTFGEFISEHLALTPRTSGTDMELGNDFRQDEIRAAWDTMLERMKDRSFTIVTLRITCASGTYMRTFAQRLAKKLGTTGFALSIHRSRIGTYKKIGPVGYWSKEY